MIIIMMLAISIGYGYLKYKVRNNSPESRTIRLTNLLSKLVRIAPFLVIVIFAILLATVLKGRFLERSSHAMIVFMLWIYATSFYIELLKYYKNKVVFISSAIGIMMAVSSAIILTPLDRYCQIIYPVLHMFSFVLGGFLFGVLYISNILFKK